MLLDSRRDVFSRASSSAVLGRGSRACKNGAGAHQTTARCRGTLWRDAGPPALAARSPPHHCRSISHANVPGRAGGPPCLLPAGAQTGIATPAALRWAAHSRQPEIFSRQTDSAAATPQVQESALWLRRLFKMPPCPGKLMPGQVLRQEGALDRLEAFAFGVRPPRFYGLERPSAGQRWNLRRLPARMCAKGELDSDNARGACERLVPFSGRRDACPGGWVVS